MKFDGIQLHTIKRLIPVIAESLRYDYKPKHIKDVYK